MTIKDRLKKIIELNGLSVSKFEKSISVTNGYINNISKNIGIDKLEKIIELYPDLNIEWLLTGKGEMFRIKAENLKDENVKRILEIQNLNEDDQKRILDMIDLLLKDAKTKK